MFEVTRNNPEDEKKEAHHLLLPSFNIQGEPNVGWNCA
jgi:hypothetical protein